MSARDAEYIYSIYTDDDDVCLYDTLEDARRAQKRRENLVEVKGPFLHLRHELPLVRAAALAVRDIRRLLQTVSNEQATQLERVARELENAASAVFPLKRVPLESGDSINLHLDLSDDPRQ